MNITLILDAGTQFHHQGRQPAELTTLQPHITSGSYAAAALFTTRRKAVHS
ncbi:hypothetical protein [Actinomadura harenae]|uniref:hypothetical protein n=1 Tax=Actinomadura harenae TaxID=2483351 RepID=UPI001315A579|nr:hypothetical protein [Actinomadura harenae]